MLLLELLVIISLLLLVAVVAMVARKYRSINTQQQKIPEKPVQSFSQSKDESVLIDSEKLDERLQKQADDALKLTTSFQKFVPKQFIEHFTRNGLDSLELGHAIETTVSIMFCDIRGFTSLAEKMTPKELINFLNSYFYRMNDPIHQNSGFIDKFIGDAIMAVFDRKRDEQAIHASDAVKASVELCRALELYNTQRAKSGYSPIKIAIGMHSGNVVVGTVGSEDRMDTTVIGDAVNVAERIEKLSSAYEVDVLITDVLLEQAQSVSHFAYRFVDRLKVRGRRQFVDVYEVLEHLSGQEKERKLSVAELIMAGVEHRTRQRWEEAIENFEQAIIINPKDRLAFYHLKKCIELKNAYNDIERDDKPYLSV